MAFLGIDLGGTYVRAALVDAKGRILSVAKMGLENRSPEAVVDAIAFAEKEVTGNSDQPIDGVGVGVAGQLVEATGRIAVAPNLKWRDVPFGEMVSTRLGRPIRLVNDLSAAAWGEFRAGAGKGTQNLFVVFVGSGVGSAIIADGRLLTGQSGVAGEFGHVKVVPEGRQCGCGERGCLEAYAGGHNLNILMCEALDSGKPTLMRELSGGDRAKLTPVLLETAAGRGDELAKEILDRAVAFLGLAIANQVTVLNPGKLILGGGVLGRCPEMRNGIAQGVATYATRTSRAAVEVVDAGLGDDSGIIGAALLAAEQLGG